MKNVAVKCDSIGQMQVVDYIILRVFKRQTMEYASERITLFYDGDRKYIESNPDDTYIHYETCNPHDEFEYFQNVRLGCFDKDDNVIIMSYDEFISEYEDMYNEYVVNQI